MGATFDLEPFAHESDAVLVKLIQVLFPDSSGTTPEEAGSRDARSAFEPLKSLISRNSSMKTTVNA